jgi:hypothetical protein
LVKYAIIHLYCNEVKTTETINGIPVEIEWEFHEIMERHDSNWCEWVIFGEGSDGKTYAGGCGADKNHPYDFHDDPENIEEVE